MDLAPLPLEGHVGVELLGDRSRRSLRARQVVQRGVGRATGRSQPRGSCAQTSGGVMPPHVRGQDQRCRELLAGRLPGGLLLRLGGKSPGLRPKLDKDVFHAREVCFGLGELLLRLPASPVVTPDPGHFLEQRSALLRSQREGLVDHALADEQERIVGKVRGVEQIDEVL